MLQGMLLPLWGLQEAAPEGQGMEHLCVEGHHKKHRLDTAGPHVPDRNPSGSVQQAAVQHDSAGGKAEAE